MYLQPSEKHFACDIETDGLLDTVTKIFCVTTCNTVTKEERSFTDCDDFSLWMSENPDAIFVGHNFLSFDAVVLNRLWRSQIPVRKIVDTFVLSQLFSPTYAAPKGCRKGGHSLEAWGIRLGYPKGEFDDFTSYSPRMLQYCRRDTRLTALLFRRLTERMRAIGFTERGCEIEHRAWSIIQNQQKRNGFPFNQEKAHELYVTLRAREEELRRDIYALWPPRLEVVGTYKGRLKKDGCESAQYLRHLGQYPKLSNTDDNGYTAHDWVSFNLGSPAQRIEKLLALGWKPVKFTKKTKKGGGGNPQVDEDSLLEFAETNGSPELKSLAKWIVVNSRANMIKTWMDAYDERTKAIHGSLFLASTLRYKHSGPNSANIPSVRIHEVDGHDEPLLGEAGAWTYESRDLWWAGEDEDFTLVGIDAKGVQLRVLANYIDVPAFTENILSEDPHTANMKTFGLPSRRLTKTITYATLMGAGDTRISNEAKVSMAEAKAGKEAFFKAVPSLPGLISRLQEELSKTGRIKLCDGTPILVSSPHMVIPYLLQGDESRLMKQAMIYMDEEIRRNGLSKFVFKVADIHDEHQWRVHASKTEEFISLALPCFIRAGESFGYGIKIEGDAKIGRTWASTH